MKKLIIICIALLLPVAALAWMNVTTVGGGVVPGEGGGCTTSNDASIYDQTGLSLPDYAHITGTDHSNLPVAEQFTLAGATTITAYVIDIIAITTSGQVTASLYTDSSGSLGSKISGTEVLQTISSTGVNTLALATPKTGVSGTVWLVITGNDATTEMYTKYRNWGYSHRIYINGEYADSSGSETGVYGCTE